MVILSNPQKKILYVSDCWVGKTHDYGMFKKEFPPEQDWFKDFTVRVDLGFLGIDKDYKCKNILLPYKKKKIAHKRVNAFMLNTLSVE